MRKLLLLILVMCVCGLTHVQAQTASSVVVKSGNTFCCGEQQMNRAAYKQFLQDECPQAYRQYKQGQQCMIAGWTLFGVGLAGASVCIPAWMISGFGASATPKGESSPAKNANNVLTGCVIAAGVVALVSVPLLSVGYVLMDNKSVKTYNGQCAKQNPELAFALTGSGANMTIRF